MQLVLQLRALQHYTEYTNRNNREVTGKEKAVVQGFDPGF